MYKFILILFTLVLACSSDEDMCGPVQIIDHGGLIQTNGGMYIACDLEPHYINLDSIFPCSLNFTLDSMFADSWQYPCTIDTVVVDSTMADFSFTYLADGFQLEVYNQSLSVETFSPIINGDTLQEGEYPFYGAYRITRMNEVIDLILVNRWVGGCFHDELVWRRTY